LRKKKRRTSCVKLFRLHKAEGCESPVGPIKIFNY
jgi:hypothetical protein